MVADAWGWEWEVTADGPEGSRWSDESVLKLDYDGCTTWHLLKKSFKCTLKNGEFYDMQFNAVFKTIMALGREKST